MIRRGRIVRGVPALLATVLLSFGAGPGPDFSQVGFSTVPALGVKGTTGGGDAAPVVVRTAEELRSAVERLDLPDREMRDATPRVVRVANDIDLGELKNGDSGDVIKDVGLVRIRSHTTLYASGPGATLRRGTLVVHGAHNVIVRNLAFRDLWEHDPSGEYDRFDWDYLRVTRQAQTLSHHVWIDHCDFGKVYDGQLDVVHGSDFVTVSWCRFAGDERGPQKKVTLVGHSSNNGDADRGRLNVTFHHNWYEAVAERTPRARFGNVHSFNNYVRGATCATMSVCGAVTLVEANHYEDTAIATSFSHAADTVAAGRGGTIAIVGSLNTNPRPTSRPSDERERFEHDHNFKPNVERAALQFNAPAAALDWPDRNALPYRYTPAPAEAVAEIVRAHAGVGKVELP